MWKKNSFLVDEKLDIFFIRGDASRNIDPIKFSSVFR